MAAGASVVVALAWAWAGTGCLTVNAARPRLPSGAGGHSHDADRLRIVAELHGYDGWLLGCRDKGLRRGRQQFMVTLLEALGAPSGTIGAGLAAAGVLRCADYMLAGDLP